MEHRDHRQISEKSSAHEAMAGNGLHLCQNPKIRTLTDEQEIGITGGEEDGVNNESVDNSFVSPCLPYLPLLSQVSFTPKSSRGTYI